jgi:DNA modification methylase
LRLALGEKRPPRRPALPEDTGTVEERKKMSEGSQLVVDMFVHEMNGELRRTYEQEGSGVGQCSRQRVRTETWNDPWEDEFDGRVSSPPVPVNGKVVISWLDTAEPIETTLDALLPLSPELLMGIFNAKQGRSAEASTSRVNEPIEVERKFIDPFDGIHVRPIEAPTVTALRQIILAHGWNQRSPPMILYEKDPRARRYKYGIVDGQHRNLALDSLEIHPPSAASSAYTRVFKVRAIVLRFDTPRVLLQAIANAQNAEAKTHASGKSIWSTLCSVARVSQESERLNVSENSLVTSRASLVPGIENAGSYRHCKNILGFPPECIRRIRELSILQDEWHAKPRIGENGEEKAPLEKRVPWTLLRIGKIVFDYEPQHEVAKLWWLEEVCTRGRERGEPVAVYRKMLLRAQRVHMVDEEAKNPNSDLDDAKALHLKNSIKSGANDKQTDEEFRAVLGYPPQSAAEGEEGPSQAVSVGGSKRSSASASAAEKGEAARKVEEEEIIAALVRPCQMDAFELLKREDMTGTITLFLTDPPYGDPGVKPINEWNVGLSTEQYAELGRLMQRCLRPFGTVLVFCDPRRSTEISTAMNGGGLQAYKRHFHWVKTNMVQKQKSACPAACMEDIVYLKKRDEKQYTSDWSGNPYPWRFLEVHQMPSCSAAEKIMRVQTDGKKVPVRPEQKPVRYLMALILMFTKRGDYVCDPFMGVGSVAVACALTGRVFMGCDKDPIAVHYTNLRLRALLESFQQKKTNMKPAWTWKAFASHYHLTAAEDERLNSEDAEFFEKPLKEAEDECAAIEEEEIFKPIQAKEVIFELIDALHGKKTKRKRGGQELAGEEEADGEDDDDEGPAASRNEEEGDDVDGIL